MKATRKIEQEVEVKYCRVSVDVRYGERDIPNDFPLRNGDMWIGTIDIDEGVVVDWPKGKSGKLRMKVCDEGTYELLTPEKEIVDSIEYGYVPNNLLPGRYGDYINLEIDENGKITNWYSKPKLTDFFEESY